MKTIHILLIGTLIGLSGVAYADDYSVGDACKLDGLVVKAVAKNQGLYSGAPILFVCHNGSFEYGRFDDELDSKGCIFAIGRRDGVDTKLPVKDSDGNPICRDRQ